MTLQMAALMTSSTPCSWTQVDSKHELIEHLSSSHYSPGHYTNTKCSISLWQSARGNSLLSQLVVIFIPLPMNQYGLCMGGAGGGGGGAA